MKHIPQRWFLWTAAFFLVLQTFFTLLFNYPTNEIPLRDTFFVFSASRLLLLLAALMVFIAIIYWTFSQMKRSLHVGLGKIHFFITVFALLVFGIGLVVSGFFTKAPLQPNIDGSLFDYKLLNKFNRVASYFLLFAQIIFVINCLFALFFRHKKINH